MKILHVVPGLDDPCNGIAVAAGLIAREQDADLLEAGEFSRGSGDLSCYGEVWIHSCWLPSVLKSCFRVAKSGKSLIVMTHANLDFVRLKYHGWKKWLVGPIERWCLRRCAKIVATCEAEKGWIERYLGKRCPPIEVTDLKRFFDLGRKGRKDRRAAGPLHLLYLGRRHPLKGVEYLEEAVADLNSNPVSPAQDISACSAQPVHPNVPAPLCICVQITSSASGEEKERVWDWCDVLVLPTLSENFGLVVAEALERGKRVITTDGAPAWDPELDLCSSGEAIQTSEVRSPKSKEAEILKGYGGRLLYLKGYRDGSCEKRVCLLKAAIEKVRGD